MSVLHIEHSVGNYEAWKQAFDADPLNRRSSGVIKYTVFRPIDDPNYVIIDLEFDSASRAEAMLTALRELWQEVQGTLMDNPQARILDTAEVKTY